MQVELNKKEGKSTILFAVLNWGLGHAARSIPLIHKLIDQGHRIILASDGQAGLFLSQSFPELEYLELPGYNIHYNNKHIEWSLLFQAPKMLGGVSNEHRATKAICKAYNVDWIISDSRFGCFNPLIRSTIITHQIILISLKPVFSFFGNLINKYYLNRFDECWVPDDESMRLSGKLSQGSLKIPIKYIGILSRFEFEEVEEDIDVLIVLSGPEPMRSLFEKKLTQQFKQWERPLVLIRGVVEDKVNQSNEGFLTTYNYQNSKELNDLLNRSKLVISRSGYSSVMDYVHLEKKAILIPTPGQNEQIYLAKHLDHYTYFSFLEENEILEKLDGMIESFL